MSRESCDWSVWRLLSTVQFVSGDMNTLLCLFSFGNLYYPEWEYPKCSLTINRKTSVKRLNLTTEHWWTALAWHSNSQVLVCTVVCLCLCEPRGCDPNRCKAGSQTPLQAESSLSWHWYLWGKQLQWKIRGPWKTIFLSPCPFQGTDFPCKEVKNY